MHIPSSLILIIAIVLTVTGASCTTNHTASSPASPPRSATAGGSSAMTRSAATADPNSVPSIAQREVIRRQETIRRMDDAAIRASQRMAEDDLEGAVEGYRKAMDGR